MPHFHITAVFEAKGTSLEDADRAAASLFKSLHHNRVHYYEHDISASVGAYSSSKALYFSVIAEFDADAGTEEKAGEMTEEVLETLATDDVQFLAFGMTQGEQRVRPVSRAPREEEAKNQPEARAEAGEDEDRRGKKRGSRGRGRKRRDERDEEVAHEERPESFEPTVAETREVAQETTVEEEDVRGESTPAPEPAVSVAAPIKREEAPPPIEQPVVPQEPLPPPPRSSSMMRVTAAMSFRASEFGLLANGASSLDQDEFLARAIAESRTRHPELPTEIAPTHEIVVQPWGEVILTLTWAYDVLVPSASEEV